MGEGAFRGLGEAFVIGFILLCTLGFLEISGHCYLAVSTREH